MIDEDEGEQHAAAGEIRPMLSMKQVLALIPFSRATLYREMGAGRFPAAHEIAPRRIAWFKADVAARTGGARRLSPGASATAPSEGAADVAVRHCAETIRCSRRMRCTTRMV